MRMYRTGMYRKGRLGDEGRVEVRGMKGWVEKKKRMG